MHHHSPQSQPRDAPVPSVGVVEFPRRLPFASLSFLSSLDLLNRVQSCLESSSLGLSQGSRTSSVYPPNSIIMESNYRQSLTSLRISDPMVTAMDDRGRRLDFGPGLLPETAICVSHLELQNLIPQLIMTRARNRQTNDPKLRGYTIPRSDTAGELSRSTGASRTSAKREGLCSTHSLTHSLKIRGLLFTQCFS